MERDDFCLKASSWKVLIPLLQFIVFIFWHTALVSSDSICFNDLYYQVCDRFEHCDDGSDENDAGCFPDLDQVDHTQLCDSQHCSPNSKQCHNFR